MECGIRSGIRSALGNLGHIHLMRGEFERALEYFNRIVEQSLLTNEQVLSALENIAQIHLAKGAFEQCLEFLDHSQWKSAGVGRYAHRYGLLTRAQVLFRLERWTEAFSCTEQIEALARRAEDEALITTARLLRAESLVHLN